MASEHALLRAPRVTALVLAAGASRRMGPRNKLLEPIDAEPMVRHVVRTVAAACCARIVVVLGHERDAVRDALTGLPVDFVHNERHLEGMGTSVATGMTAVADDCDAVLVCLGDMPRVRTATLQALIDAYRPDLGDLGCQPTCAGRRGNPLLWSAEAFAALRQLAGDVGARTLIAHHAHRIRRVDVDDEGVLFDVDTVTDLPGGGPRQPPGRR